MAEKYIVEAVHQGGMHFVAHMGDRAVDLDYPLVPGDAGAGPKPMQMLLASLAACAGGTVAALLRRAQQPFRDLKVSARGLRRSEHPTVFTEISLEFVVGGPVDREVMGRVLGQAENAVCPVWTMLKQSTPIRSSYRICVE